MRFKNTFRLIFLTCAVIFFTLAMPWYFDNFDFLFEKYIREKFTIDNLFEIAGSIITVFALLGPVTLFIDKTEADKILDKQQFLSIFPYKLYVIFLRLANGANSNIQISNNLQALFSSSFDLWPQDLVIGFNSLVATLEDYEQNFDHEDSKKNSNTRIEIFKLILKYFISNTNEMYSFEYNKVQKISNDVRNINHYFENGQDVEKGFKLLGLFVKSYVGRFDLMIEEDMQIENLFNKKLNPSSYIYFYLEQYLIQEIKTVVTKFNRDGFFQSGQNEFAESVMLKIKG